MKFNILSLNTVFLNRFEEEEKTNAERLKLLESFLNGEYTFDDMVKSELIKQREIIVKSLGNKQMYIAKTRLLVDEYANILKQPLSRDSEKDNPMIKRKEEICSEYYSIVKEIIRKKNWFDIQIPSERERSDNVELSVCAVCGNDESNLFEVDEFNRKTCLNCSTQHSAIETGVTHHDYNRVNVVGKFIYNRVLHFQDCIKQYQGKQNCKIPDKLFADLDYKFKAYRLLIESDIPHIRYSKITRTHIIMFLKELKYTKHYENVNLIYFTLTNKQVDDISHLEQKLVEDFKQLVALYDGLHGKDKPEELDRKNFMNVQYLLFQLLKRHNHPCKIEDFTILKTVDRKQFHDNICKNLFEKLGWNFTPTF